MASVFFSDLEEDIPALRVRKQDVSEHCIFPIARWRVIQDEGTELTEENSELINRTYSMSSLLLFQEP